MRPRCLPILASPTCLVDGASVSDIRIRQTSGELHPLRITFDHIVNHHLNNLALSVLITKNDDVNQHHVYLLKFVTELRWGESKSQNHSRNTLLMFMKPQLNHLDITQTQKVDVYKYNA